ncbi:MAG: sugar phosphorylase, partial [Chloroflexota bacterium]
MSTILKLVTFVYGEEPAQTIVEKIEALIDEFRPEIVPPSQFFTEQDVILITYGDMVSAEGERPLATLHTFLNHHAKEIVNTVHILPFYPYSSDDGFSVIDYTQVNPDFGNWDDIKRLRQDFKLMFDAVINHISQKSEWFQAFLEDEAPYREYFTVVDPHEDLTAVFRPRTLPLLTPAQTPSGLKHVWTTFSADQIDLNYESVDLLLEILRVLLIYVQNGADLIRLDAIGFMWKEIGTRCLHLPQTHTLIQLMRLVLEEVAPATSLVTETNVPHEENISYFGNGRNEAQMVYNFSLPPLTLHAFHTGNATILSDWARTLAPPSDTTTFFNFCASHDGIGVTPARGILSEHDIQAMAHHIERLGGFVSYKTNSNGTQAAYELNMNYYDALKNPDIAEDTQICINRFLTSQAIMLALRGVPGIYFHSLFGSLSWFEGVRQTQHNRTINRQKLTKAQLETEIKNGRRYAIFSGYSAFLKARKKCTAFHPNAQQTVLALHPAVF